MFFISETDYRIFSVRPDHPRGDSMRMIALDFLIYPEISTFTSFEKGYSDFPKFIRNVTKIDPQLLGSPLDLLKDSFFFKFHKKPGSRKKCFPVNLVVFPEIF
jgi:hypothetical protein